MIKLAKSFVQMPFELIFRSTFCLLCLSSLVACGGSSSGSEDGALEQPSVSVQADATAQESMPQTTLQTTLQSSGDPESSEPENSDIAASESPGNESDSQGADAQNVVEPNNLQQDPRQESQPASDVVQSVTDFRATVADITDLVLVTGQSNALGAGTAFNEFLDAPHDRVMAYTNDGWQTANLNQIWDQDWFPRNHPDTPPSNNFSLHFAKRVASKAPDRVIGFILVTAPGEAISHWRRDGAFFNVIRDRVSRAINELPYKSGLEAILWHQGESDGQDRDEYGDALYDLIERFRSEPWFGADLPFICGETARSPVNRQLARLNSDDDYWTACVAAEGLSVLPDSSHFTADSLRTIGSRYGDVYLERMLGIQ